MCTYPITKILSSTRAFSFCLWYHVHVLIHNETNLKLKDLPNYISSVGTRWKFSKITFQCMEIFYKFCLLPEAIKSTMI